MLTEMMTDNMICNIQNTYIYAVAAFTTKLLNVGKANNVNSVFQWTLIKRFA